MLLEVSQLFLLLLHSKPGLRVHFISAQLLQLPMLLLCILP